MTPDQTIDPVLEMVAGRFGFTLEDLRRRDRTRPLVEVRQVAAFVARKTLIDVTFESIAGRIERHHSTVIEACAKTAGYCDLYPDFRARVEDLIYEATTTHAPTMIKFADFTADERVHVDRIARRAVEMFCRVGIMRDTIDVTLDLACVHQTIPLRLEELADADAFNFSHDLYGICDNLNRSTGQLENGFRPRFAKPQTEDDGRTSKSQTDRASA